MLINYATFIYSNTVCKDILPIWDSLASKYHHNKDFDRKIVIGRVNCEEDPSGCSMHKVQNYPT